MSENTRDIGQRLGFTPAWFAIGVVDEALLLRLRDEWDKGEDANPEHYRYWAFREFLTSHRPLLPALAAALFELGAADPDQAMGGSIMADIARLPECPDAVLDAALRSGRKHLARIVILRAGDAETFPDDTSILTAAGQAGCRILRVVAKPTTSAARIFKLDWPRLGRRFPLANLPAAATMTG